MAFNFIAQGWEGKVEGREGVRREKEMRGDEGKEVQLGEEPCEKIIIMTLR